MQYPKIYNLPGIKVASDLIGYKIIRTMQVISTGLYFDIEHTICGTFLNDQTDESSYYISFATIKPTVSGIDSNFQTNIYNIENQSAGMWVSEDLMNKYGYRTHMTYFFVPTEFPTSTTPSTTLKPYNCHPDGKSVILSVFGPSSEPDYYQSTMGRGESSLVITDAYAKNPTDHTLIGEGKRKELISGTVGGQY